MILASLAAALGPLAGRGSAQQPASAGTPASPPSATTLGYYRFPAIHDNTIVFTAEGDLWTVGVGGGIARRLTTGRGAETNAAVSPDGRTVAFSASYEGPVEVYTMPIDGGLPVRRTWDGGPNIVQGWTPDGRILYATRSYSTLPDAQLVEIDTSRHTRTPLPLAEAAEGAFDGATLFFTRLPFQGSHTRRYQGGMAQQLWKWADGMAEAEPLTGDYAGTSRQPMVWDGRVYFVSDRDGTMNLWSMDEGGHALRQLTHHARFDVQAASLSKGRIVYQHGADLRLFDTRDGADRAIPIRLASDFDQMRERWVDSAATWVSSVHLSPHGRRIVLTARGQLFVAPVEKDQGRLVQATRRDGVRYRDGRFMPDGATLLSLSDESGEVELWTLPASGVGAPHQLTHDGTILRWDAIPAPDGRRIAHYDKGQRLWIYDVAAGTSRLVARSEYGDFGNLAWSPDSRWLAYTAPGANLLERVFVYDTRERTITAITSDRYDSGSPAWSPDGRWLWLLSDRHFRSLVGSPWGSRQPEPFFDRQTEIYGVALRAGERFPFEHGDELHPEPATAPRPEPAAPSSTAARGRQARGQPAAGAAGRSRADTAVTVEIDTARVAQRLHLVPVAPGNYDQLSTDGERLFVLARETTAEGKRSLDAITIGRTHPAVTTLAGDVRGYELSADRRKLLVRKANDFFVIDAHTRGAAKLDSARVDLSGWNFAIDPREEWRQMYREAWRLERDYFYAPNMKGVDWAAMRDKYEPLAERVTDRDELADVLGQMISELSALHMFVRGGDMREAVVPIEAASLGARLERDPEAGGYRVAHIYRNDPDRPDALSPLARDGAGVRDGDVILQVNGTAALSASSLDAMLRNQAGRQVRLRIRPRDGGAERDVIIEPITPRQDASLRYDEWEYTRRLLVDSLSGGTIGYVHLRAMGSADMAQFERDFYPVFARRALIVDARDNLGGNIDSWILEKLMRRAWMYWQHPNRQPMWNMQEAFRGPMIVLVNQRTSSDGEAFAEGFRRLGLGPVLGMRTWGGEIWLTSSNILVDRGIATAAEMGVYGPKGEWLVEGKGVVPDSVVDNGPHRTFEGEDAQLRAAVAWLQREIRAHPNPVPAPPSFQEVEPRKPR